MVGSLGARARPRGRRGRANACKHGLTGEGVVLSTEDAEKVAGRFTTLLVETALRTPLGTIIVKRTAMFSVRFDRAYEQEGRNLSTRLLSAETDLADRRQSEAEMMLRRIAECPATHLRRLRATPEGVKVMLARRAAMKADLDHAEGCRGA